MDELKAERRGFLDNRDGNTVAAALAAYAEYEAHQREVAIASGYFDLGGFLVIADLLERVPRVRILLGTEPEPPKARRVILPGTPPAQPPVTERLAELRQALEADRDLLPFEPSTGSGVRRLLAFLDRPTTEVRIYRREFLHGKAFIFGDEAGILAGSANFTAAGLCHNLELDLGVYDPDKVGQARRWFDDLWEMAEPFALADLYRGRETEYDPYTIYLRMLYELYGHEVAAEADALPVAPGRKLELAEFQKLGVQRALRILDRWGGVLVADGVGLGKTYIAGELIEHHLATLGWRVLVVAPASLRDATWDRFMAEHSRFAVEVISYQQLANDSQVGEPPNGGADGRQPHLKLDASEYRCIVIDEAHAFRSPETTYYRALRRLMAAGGVEKRLIMLTATPVNNSLWDLYWQLLLFARTESRFAELGIPNLREHVARAMTLDLEALTPAHLFPLLDAVSVRRTRGHIKRWFPGARLPSGMPIEFPIPNLQKVAYESARPDDATSAGEYFAQVAAAIDGGLSMARYQPDLYRRTGDGAAAQQVTSQLLLSGLLKRFESSLEAFRRTLTAMIGTHDRFLEWLERGYVLQPTTSKEAWSEALDDEAVDRLLGGAEDDPPVAVGEYDADSLRERAGADRALLMRLLERARTIEPDEDPKLEALLDVLDRVDRSAGHADERKLVVFSYFADTMAYVDTYLRQSPDPRAARYRDRMASVSGSNDPRTRQHTVWGFVPKSSEAPPGQDEDLYDLLLSTDVLAEGQNLQQCGTVVNFDLPWNPMRIVQRNGRIDRIGSPHRTVHLYSFFPGTELDAMLDLEAKLKRKIAQANAAVGTEGRILPDTAPVDIVFDDTREEIERIAAGDASLLEEKEAELDAFSGEVFREELRQALMAARERELQALPWGIGSGLDSKKAQGVVFAARAGSRIEWRYVPLRTEDQLSGDRLALLGYVRCTPESTRHLPDEVRDDLYSLWGRARDAIYSDRMAELDPATRFAAVPKAQRDAVDILLAATTLDPTALDQIIEALSVAWPPTVARALRPILDHEDESTNSKAERIAEFVRAEGLRAPELPAAAPITRDDIHLVCYQVVTS